jgi:N-methylhydantoinase B
MNINMSKNKSHQVYRSWNFNLAQCETLHSLFERTLEITGNSALVLTDGSLLHVRPSGPADLATLGSAATLCHKYLRLADGDVAVLNDPYSGGTTLSDITLVMGINLETPGESPLTARGSSVPLTDLLLVRRISLAPRFSGRHKIDDEGARIPPTPLVSGGILNTGLLEAIALHPQVPAGFGIGVQQALESLEQVRRDLKAISREPSSEFRRSNFKTYLANSSELFESRMSRLPLGSTTISKQLSSGETLKLSLTVTEQRILFDFAGSDASASIGLTELVTLGTCLAATASFMHEPIPMNAGSFEHIQLSAPVNSMLSVRAPSATLRGVQMGVAIVAGLIEAALTNLNPGFSKASSAGFDGTYQLIFDDNRLFAGRLAPGLGAQRNFPGVDAFGAWAPRHAFHLPLEEAESRFPLKWASAGIHADSAGKGSKRGGNGSQHAFYVTAPAKLRWLLGPATQKQDGVDGGHAGQAGSVLVRRATTDNTAPDEIHSDPEGEISLNSGDFVQLSMCGGGGYGAPSGGGSHHR